MKRIVHAKIKVNEFEVKIIIVIECNARTPDSELIRRAGNILRESANNATYEVSKHKSKICPQCNGTREWENPINNRIGPCPMCS